MNTEDARDILELGGITPARDGRRARRSGAPREKKPDGVNRELFNLIGGLATLPLTETRAKLKERPNFSAKHSRWVWKGFTNSARDDDLVLYHWINEADESTDRSFAGFNNVVDVVEYNEDEYARLLIDRDWSKDETDYLFDMCKRFDLRFIVIADRYDFEGKSRDIEEIKDRYYTVSRRILKLRAGGLSEGLEAYAFDRDREEERKRILDRLFSRTQAQIKEEEALLVEMRRIQQQQRRLQRDHEHVMRLLNIREAPTMPQLPAGSRAGGAGGSSKAHASSNGSRSATATDMETPRPSASIKKKKPPRKESNAAALDRPDIKGEPPTPGSASALADGMPSTPLARKDKLPVGVCLRSSRIQPIRAQTTVNKVLGCFRELSIGPRPVMATERVCANYDQLQQSVLKMLDRKKYADRLEQELRTLKHRRSELSGKPLPDGAAIGAALSSTSASGGGSGLLGDAAFSTPSHSRKRSGGSSATASHKRSRR
ncbi:hypothetical protein THASP1DRAFT_27418 [Thamnocephalis sphaerospora]|uniref:SWR1-complex protein 4 n=1 Tax=Thamnocephalis sphaerospora TaxID=78915 RepID=A0A4P9XXP4_9FUNG|nr:hypothetical protein THASP1DRAFT_27418 [Thamnocephalis sphaerospora]|eukprot:RKP10822.1 hypothetical protein THASP1DRAFT_27418 [Thamnocephalis sphaerospora]